MDWARLPSSTFNVVRRRAYEAGWIEDHLVPDPGALGLLPVRFVLSQPSASVRADLLHRWASDPACAVLHEGTRAVLAVLFGSREPTVVPPEGSWVLKVDGRTGHVPVYFDFSGLWARFGQESPPGSYPQELRVTPRDPGVRDLGAARLALQHAHEASGPSASSEQAPEWQNVLHLPRSQRRALEDGVLSLRSIPDLARIPPYGEARIGEVVLITGELRGSSGIEPLLHSLTADCRVFPFLFVESEGRVLLGGAAQTSARFPGRVPLSSARRAVMPTLLEHLDHVDYWLEPVESWRTVVDHRYERTLSGALADRAPVNPQIAPRPGS
jgi:hypothetical protein